MTEHKLVPINVTCPQCGAGPGQACWVGAHRNRRMKPGFHHRRIRAAAGDAVSESFVGWLERPLKGPAKR